jgi:hypothetical protein
VHSLLIISFLVLWQMNLSAQSIAINEVMSSNSNSIADEDGDYEDWIELYNYGSTTINLEGYGLSDNDNRPFKWSFPSVSLGPGQFLLVWASGKNRTSPGNPLHTNFSISAAGEEITLTGVDGTLIDRLEPTPIPTDYSYGRFPDGTGNWVYYTDITPNAPNSSVTTIHPPDPPVFSVKSGFYNGGFNLTLSHPVAGAMIIYTLDGSQPKTENLNGVTYYYKNQHPEFPGQQTGQLLSDKYTSISYTGPINITDRSSAPNKLANISSTYHFSPDYFPSNPIKKATVVKAIAIVGGVSSQIKTHTYFVSNTSAFNSHLPIVSITVNEDGLFDFNDGIYVAGKDFETWRAENPNEEANGHRPANYRRRGIETEQSASFQYFVDGKEVLNQNIGLRIHGGATRAAQLKSFRLYARSAYDSQNTFEYPFFGPDNSGSFKRLILRNSGNDSGHSINTSTNPPTYRPSVFFRDAVIQKMVSHLRFETLDYMPTITYVNGEYWGMLNLRERYDKHYLERRFGIHENDLDYLERNAVVVEGNNNHFLMMRDFISANNMANNQNYERVQTLMDTDNFMDYQITQIFIRNTDWPAGNIDYFRKKTEQYIPGAPYGQDGRWRWLLFDTDYGFGYIGSYDSNTLEWATLDNNWPTVILVKLLENQSFRNDFINRYADLLNTAFLPERVIGLINEFADRIASEVPTHRNRWNTLHEWENAVNVMREFADKRPLHARSHIRSKFDISGQYQVTLNVSDPAHGYINVNTIKITGKTPGVSANPYPWSGIYFNNIPVVVTAVPNPGYEFSHWSGAYQSTEAVLEITANQNLTLQANFIPAEEDQHELIYFWLMDENIENDTPLQSLISTWFINDTPATIEFFSSFGLDYPFGQIHTNWRKGSMERRNAPTPINYFPLANNGLEYGSFEMRGIQIKEPFLSNGFENTLIINCSTTNYKNIKLSFAAKDEGAAHKLIIDYFDPHTEKWVNSGLFNASPDLTSEYKQYHIDFSNVSIAENNDDLQLRLRFAGTDMTKDNGNRVVFNNFAITGTSFIPELTDSKYLVSIFPNPTIDRITIQSELPMAGFVYEIYNMLGSLVLRGLLNEHNTIVSMEHLSSGVYLLNIIDNTQSVKIIKE